MLLAVNFCRKVALLLLISPGMTMTAGPFLLALVYVICWYMPWSAAALAFCDVSRPAVGDGLPNVGCADVSVAAPRSAAPSRYRAKSIEASCLMAFLLSKSSALKSDRT